jgi:hypothetical protein
MCYSLVLPLLPGVADEGPHQVLGQGPPAHRTPPTQVLQPSRWLANVDQ